MLLQGQVLPLPNQFSDKGLAGGDMITVTGNSVAVGVDTAFIAGQQAVTVKITTVKTKYKIRLNI